MKKNLFLLGLITTTVCLTACGSKNYEMSFEDALDAISTSTLQEILSDKDNVHQTLNIGSNIDKDGNKITANLQVDSKQNNKNNDFDSTTDFDINIDNEGENLKIDGNLDLRLIDESLYLNLKSLDFEGSEDVSFIDAMIGGFKNQWFFIPMSGLNEISKGYITNTDSLKAEAKEILVNEGLTTYDGKFTQFNGYNARKISLNSSKLQEIINEYYTTSENEIEIPQLNIENFDGYLVITGKDKVTIVVDNMDIIDEESSISASGFGGKDYSLTLSSGGEDVITLSAKKKSSHYDISIEVLDMASLKGTITPKLSKSQINLKFDLEIYIKSEYGNDTLIPLKGNRAYEPISEFSITTPSDARDLSEMFGNYLGNVFGGDDSYYDDEYSDYDLDDYSDYNSDEEYNDSEEFEAIESVEFVESIETEEIIEEVNNSDNE